MQHLYFVRHGLSIMNEKGIFSGRTETPLSPEGIEQAKRAGAGAHGLGIDCIVSSPMKRALDTAKLIAKEIGIREEDIIISDHFMEREFGLLEGTPYTPDMEMDHIDGVETVDQILERAKTGLAYLQSLPHDTILVCSHGAIGRALRCAIEPDTEFMGSEKFNNAVIVKLR